MIKFLHDFTKKGPKEGGEGNRRAWGPNAPQYIYVKICLDIYAKIRDASKYSYSQIHQCLRKDDEANTTTQSQFQLKIES
jgi:hypothetical protein